MASDLTLGVTIGAAMASSWKSVVGNVRTDLSKLGQEVQKTTRLQRDVGRLAGMQSGMGKTRNELQEARREAERYRLQMALAQKEGGKAAVRAEKDWQKATRKVETLTNRLARQQDQTNRLGSTLRQAGVNTRDLSAANEELARSLEKQNAAFLKQKNLVESRAEHRQNFMRHAAKLGAALVVGRQAVGTALSFESAMADVRKVVDFDSADQFDAMGKGIRDMSQWIGMGADQIAQLVAAGGQANIARHELLRFAEDAGKMGVAFDMSAEEAGQTMAQWRTALEMNQDEVRELADQINYLGNTGPANAQKISAIVTRIGALGDVAGLNGAAIAALGSTITGVGISEEIAATGIKNLMLTLTQGTAATNKQKAAFRALGLDAEDVAAAMQEDAGGAIREVLSAIKDLDKQEQAAILTQLFGRESVGAIAPLLKNLNVLEENLNKVSDSQLYAGSMQKEFAARMDTTRQALGNTGNVLANTGRIIGTVLLPPIKWTAQAIGSLFRGINWLLELSPALTTVVVGATAAWLSWGAATSAVKFGLTFLPGVMTTLIGVVPKLVAGVKMMRTAMILFNAAVLANPLVWVGAAIVGVGAAIAGAAYLIYKHWEPIKEFFGGLVDSVFEIGRGIGNFFGLGGDEEPTSAPAAEKVVNAAVKASPISAGSRPAIQQTISSQNSFEIHTAPGMSERDVADEVVRRIDEAERQRAARQRSALYDQE